MTINPTLFLLLIAGVIMNPKSATTPPPLILPIAVNPALSLASFNTFRRRGAVLYSRLEVHQTLGGTLVLSRRVFNSPGLS